MQCSSNKIYQSVTLAQTICDQVDSQSLTNQSTPSLLPSQLEQLSVSDLPLQAVLKSQVINVQPSPVFIYEADDGKIDDSKNTIVKQIRSTTFEKQSLNFVLQPPSNFV